MARRIGLFGGTFNPVHVGHLVLAEEALERLQLEAVWWIPVAEPPLKAERELASAADRLRMVELAIAGQPAFQALDVEIRRGGKSYTVETVQALRAQDQQSAFYWLVGSDACGQFHAWRAFDELLQLCQVVVVTRPGATPGRLPAGVQTLEIPLLDISSTDIRRRLARGRSIRYLVPDAVRNDIMARRLYQPPAA